MYFMIYNDKQYFFFNVFFGIWFNYSHSPLANFLKATAFSHKINIKTIVRCLILNNLSYFEHNIGIWLKISFVYKLKTHSSFRYI